MFTFPAIDLILHMLSLIVVRLDRIIQLYPDAFGFFRELVKLCILLARRLSCVGSPVNLPIVRENLFGSR